MTTTLTTEQRQAFAMSLLVSTIQKADELVTSLTAKPWDDDVLDVVLPLLQKVDEAIYDAGDEHDGFTE